MGGTGVEKHINIASRQYAVEVLRVLMDVVIQNVIGDIKLSYRLAENELQCPPVSIVTAS